MDMITHSTIICTDNAKTDLPATETRFALRVCRAIIGCCILSLALATCATPQPAPPPPPLAPRDIWSFLQQGQTEEAKPFLLGSTDINSRDSNGMTPLHWAAEHRSPDFAEFLLARGAAVDAEDSRGRTPLDISADKGDSATAGVLVNHHAYIHHSAVGSTPALRALGAKGAFLRSILNAESLQSADTQGRTILHLAALAGDAGSVSIILEFGNMVHLRDQDGSTPLDLAFSETNTENYPETAAALILAGGISANPIYPHFAPAVRANNYNLRSAQGITPLHYAAQEGLLGYGIYLLNRNGEIDAKTASGTTPFHEAVRAGHIPMVELLLARGANIDAQDGSGNSAMHLASSLANSQEIIALLLEKRENPNLRDIHGDTPLHCMVMLNREPNALQTLLDGGADVTIRNMEGKTPLFAAVEQDRAALIPLLLQYRSDIFASNLQGITPIEQAFRKDESVLFSLVTPETTMQSDSYGNTILLLGVQNAVSVEIVGAILDNQGYINARNRDGDTALHIAIRTNQRDTGLLLLSRGADLFTYNARNENPLFLCFYSPGSTREWALQEDTLQMRDGQGNSPLHYAAQWKLDEYIPLMVSRGGNVDARNVLGETPLFSAVKANSPSTVRTLAAQGASINARDSLGNSALHASVRWNTALAAEALIAAGGDINGQGFDGKAPLHLAVELGIPEVELALLRGGANLEIRDNEGNTPFMGAIIAGNPQETEKLIALGAVTMARNNRGDTPLHLAVAQERSDLVNLLLTSGAAIHNSNSRGLSPYQLALATSPRMVSTLLTKDRILAADDNGNPPLHIAIAANATPELIAIILYQGGEVQGIDAQGRTALRLALEANNWEAAKILAGAGADPFARAGDTLTPTDIAFSKGEAAIRAVFSSSSAIDALDGGGNTPLHYAAQRGDLDTITVLLELGARRTQRNYFGETPLDIAQRWQHTEILPILTL